MYSADLNMNLRSSNKKKHICDNHNCPLRGYEFHWCSTPGCPLSNHCHLDNDKCEIVEPGFLAEKQQRFQNNLQRQQQPTASNQAYFPQQAMFQQQAQSSKLFQPQVSTQIPPQIQRRDISTSMSSQSNMYATLPRNYSRQSQQALNQPQSQKNVPVPNQNFNNIDPKLQQQQKQHRTLPRSTAQRQEYSNGTNENSDLDENYPQYNDCVQVPIVVLKKVDINNQNQNLNQRLVNQYSSMENLNTVSSNFQLNSASNYQLDDVQENQLQQQLQQQQDFSLNQNQGPQALRSSSTMNIDCDIDPLDYGKITAANQFRHSPTFDCLINNIIQKYYQDVNKHSNRSNPGSVTNLNENEQIQENNLNEPNKLSSSSTSNLRSPSNNLRSPLNMPMTRLVDKSKNVSFSDFNLNDPNQNRFDPSLQNESTHLSGNQAHQLPQQQRQQQQRQQNQNDQSFRDAPFNYDNDYKAKFDERLNRPENDEFKRTTYTTQYSTDKRVPEYINSDNYELPRFKEFKEYTYKEVTKLIKEFKPSRSKPAPPPNNNFIGGTNSSQASIKDRKPFIEDLNTSIESLGQLGLEKPETFQSKYANESEVKSLGLENSNKLKQKSQASFNNINDNPSAASVSISSDNNQYQPEDLQSQLNSNMAGLNISSASEKLQPEDLNIRISQLINEQKKSNEILQTAIKSLCNAYFAQNGCQN